jgi:hypothetical protein
MASSQTLFARVGNLFAYVCVAACVLALSLSWYILHRNKNNGAGR